MLLMMIVRTGHLVNQLLPCYVANTVKTGQTATETVGDPSQEFSSMNVALLAALSTSIVINMICLLICLVTWKKNMWIW